MRFITFIISFLISVSSLFAFTVPPYEGYVTDRTQMLSTQTKYALAHLSEQLAKTNGAEVATLVVSELGDTSIEDASNQVFEKWGIGQKNKDNGVLFMIALADKKMRIEVGYGLEGLLPDGKVGAILDRNVIPAFKVGKFEEGIARGHVAIISEIDPKIVEHLQSAPRSEAQTQKEVPEWLLMLLIVLFIVLFIISPTFRNIILFILLTGFRGGGGGGQSRGGFGGGSSGGGGSSRSW